MTFESPADDQEHDEIMRLVNRIALLIERRARTGPAAKRKFGMRLASKWRL